MGIWTKRPLDNPDVHLKSGDFKRYLSTFDLILLGIGAIMGAGLFSITGIAAALHAGPAVILSFILAAFGCGFTALCYSELAAMIPVSGSAYTYAYTIMGEFIAWMIGWDLILEYSIGTATVAISWSAYVVSTLHDVGIDLPTWMIASPWQSVVLHDGTSVYGWINLPAVAIVVVLSLLLIWGIRESSSFNNYMVLIKLAAVTLFIAVGFFYIKNENYHPFIPPNEGKFGDFGISGIFQGAGIIFFAYIGFDAVSTAVRETKDPERAIPLGILGSLTVCTVFYILFATVMVGMVSYKLLNVADPVALAVRKMPFVWLHGLINIAIIAGLTSVMLVMLLGQSRIFYAMSRDGLLPKCFSAIHPKFHTPWKASLVLMLLVGLVSGFTPIAVVGEMTSIGTLLAFLIVCIAVWLLRKRHPEYPRPFRVSYLPFVAVMGVAICLLMMVSLEWMTWVRFVVWLVIGAFLYFYYGRHHSKYGNVAAPSGL